MLFKEIIGQDEVKQRLLQSVKDGRISHAQLFMGHEGSGNLALAIAYAQYIACKNRGENDSCGTCPSCVKYKGLVHPDLHFAYPITSAKENETSTKYLPEWREAIRDNPYMNLFQWIQRVGAENKQGVISVYESAEILKKLALTTYEGGYKVMIIWMPEKMNLASANKLLKILEEPPAKTLFLLATENSDHLLTTILSRTQLVKVPRIDDEDMKQALKDRHGLDESEAARVAYLAEGNYNEALYLVKHADEENFNFAQFSAWMRLCYKKDVLKLAHWVDGIATIGREKQKNFLAYALSMTRETLMVSYADSSLVRLQGEELEFVKKFSPFIHGENCISITDELNRAIRDVERNANPKIMFTDLSLKMMVLLKQAASLV
ncbi:MAG TPA: DNA polymerase III subunit [Bacteroidia bacterium]|jgi:DNA polymerase-3 subunit delta'